MKDRYRENQERENQEEEDEDVAFIVNTVGDERLTQMKVDELNRQFDFVAFGNDNSEDDVQELLKRKKITEKNDHSENVQEQLKYY